MNSTIVGMNSHTIANSKEKFSLLNHRIHFISWGIFVFWESIIIGLIYGGFGNFFNYVIHYSINISLFYLHTWLMEKLMKSGSYVILKIPIILIMELAGYITLVFYLDNILATYTNILTGSLETNRNRILMLLWRSLYFIFFSSGYFYFKKYLKERDVREMAERLSAKIMLEKEKVENRLMMSKNAFLKAQISPHLLFNTFEFLYNRVKMVAPEDAKLMIYLSEIIRFAAAAEFDDGYVKLADEIVQCENLIRIHNITQTKAFIKMSYSDDILNLRFIPLVIITLLENIFKHGVIMDNEKYSEINVYIDSELLIIQSANFSAQKDDSKGFGSGLENIRSRLCYAYGDAAGMVAGIDSAGLYQVEITVPIQLLLLEKIEAS